VKAAESLGASRIKALRSVALPLALPGLVATVVIVYVISVGFFLTPVLLGGAASPFTASLIYADIFTYYNVADAAVSGIWLLVGALGVIGVGLVCVGRERLMRALVQ
jgi:ABC-type spermidine/putrescine transport system permease subunit I